MTGKQVPSIREVRVAVTPAAGAAQMPVITASMDFEQASKAVLAFLTARLPWAFWSVTRVENGKQTYLVVDQNAYGFEPGDSHAWVDSFCIKMVAGDAPRVAPDTSLVPAYATAPVGDAIPIGAYAGSPITDDDGQLFGVLCGLNQTAVDMSVADEEPLLNLLTQLLGMVLAADRARAEIERDAQRARLEADTDALTGVSSRRAWESVVATEELNQSRFADPTVVVMVDLDGLKRINDTQGHAAGDDYIRRCAKALTSAVRDSDPVGRLGGDEFGVLLRRTSIDQVEHRIAEIRGALAAHGVAASIGWAVHTVHGGFDRARAEADAAMYANKIDRRRAS